MDTVSHHLDHVLIYLFTSFCKQQFAERIILVLIKISANKSDLLNFSLIDLLV